MKAATRALRARIADTPGIRPLLSPREIDRRNTVLRAATTLMADFPPNSFTLNQFAIAIEASPASIRRCFVDMDGVLVEILGRHLLALAAAIGQAAAPEAGAEASRRAAYLTHTRTPMGGLTPEHLLFTRDRFSLPPEDLARLEAIHLNLGEALGGLSARDVLSLLDSPVLEPAEIETVLAARTARAEAAIRLAATLPPTRAVPEPPAPAPRSVPQSSPYSLPPAAPAGERDDWMPSPSLYARHMAARPARAGP